MGFLGKNVNELAINYYLWLDLGLQCTPGMEDSKLMQTGSCNMLLNSFTMGFCHFNSILLQNMKMCLFEGISKEKPSWNLVIVLVVIIIMC